MSTSPQESSFHSLFLIEIRRRLIDECIPRAKKCLFMLEKEDIWHRPNRISNSMGNLILHLNGNVRQWLISGLTEIPDNRRRQQEFDEQGPISRNQLLEILDELQRDVLPVLEQLKPESLTATYSVQGFKETGMGILIHVVEHFSYHVGQMTYFVKAHTNSPTGYYKDKNLDSTD